MENKKTRKPLIIRGARQVGKTWLMKAFGAEAYENSVYISLDNNRRMAELFSADLSIERIVMGLELYAGHKIDPQSTLLIFDEIQETPKALGALKYFNEEASQYQIVAAGSLLGVALHHGTSFPVGKVEFMDLYPLSYPEFFMAMGKGQYAGLLGQGDFPMITTFRYTRRLPLRITPCPSNKSRQFWTVSESSLLPRTSARWRTPSKPIIASLSSIPMMLWIC